MYRAYCSSSSPSSNPSEKEMPKIRTVLIGSSVRPGRMNDRVLKFVQNRLETRDHQVELIDPVEWNLPILRTALHFYDDPTEAPQELFDLTAFIDRADAIVVTTAEYNRTMPPALINLIDHIPQIPFSMKPAGVVSYSIGGFALQAASQARQLLAEMGCLVVPHTAAISHVHKKLDEHGVTQKQDLEQSVDLLMDQLEFVVKARRSLIKAGDVLVPKPHPHS